MQMPTALTQLVNALRVFPGVGPKSAQRMAYHLLQYDQSGAVKLTEAITNALAKLTHCKQCHTLSETELCNICTDVNRDARLLCIVEMPTDVIQIEQTLAFTGFYFVLMGRISPLDGIGPHEIHMQQLMSRACEQSVEEVILATNFTVEGEATAHYIAEVLRARGLKISRIARGLPVGGELEYIDPGTLAQALVERRGIS